MCVLVCSVLCTCVTGMYAVFLFLDFTLERLVWGGGGVNQSLGDESIPWPSPKINLGMYMYMCRFIVIDMCSHMYMYT